MTFLTNEEFDKLFTTFEHTAFRLETRDSYVGVSYEVEPFERWLVGERVEWGPDDPWTRLVQAAKAAGKRFERVRAISEPWSDYSRYALWECLDNLAAGEDIRYMSRERTMAIGLPVTLPGYDYWLFDSRLLVRLHYNEANDHVHSEVVDDSAAIVQHNYWRDAAWHYALQRDEYVRQVGEPVEPPFPANM
jgi:hypothetical protein